MSNTVKVLLFLLAASQVVQWIVILWPESRHNVDLSPADLEANRFALVDENSSYIGSIRFQVKKYADKAGVEHTVSEPIIELWATNRSLPALTLRDDAQLGPSVTLVDPKGTVGLALGFDNEDNPTLVVANLEKHSDYFRVVFEKRPERLVVLDKNSKTLFSLPLGH